MLDLQMNPYVSELALYDIQGTPGVAADISHINSKAKTKVHVQPHSSEVILSMHWIWGDSAAAATSHVFNTKEMAARHAVYENACDEDVHLAAASAEMLACSANSPVSICTGLRWR